LGLGEGTQTNEDHEGQHCFHTKKIDRIIGSGFKSFVKAASGGRSGVLAGIRNGNYLSAMEFSAIIKGEHFAFSALGKNSFLVGANGVEYILYKTARWQCADEISSLLLIALGEAIDAHISKAVPA